MAELNPPEHKSALASLVGRIVLNIPGLRVTPKVEKGRYVLDQEGQPVKDTNLESPEILDKISASYESADKDTSSRDPNHISFRALRDLKDALARGEKKLGLK